MSGVPAPPAAPTKPRTLLGFDYGTRRIGVAVGQDLTATATALVTLTAQDGRPDWSRISTLIETWQPQALVVGLPYNMDGSDQAMTVAARRFGNQLRGRYNLPVHLHDERLSSVDAGRHIEASTLSRRKKQERGRVDRIAAQLILQSWLEAQQTGRTTPPTHPRVPS